MIKCFSIHFREKFLYSKIHIHIKNKKISSMLMMMMNLKTGTVTIVSGAQIREAQLLLEY